MIEKSTPSTASNNFDVKFMRHGKNSTILLLPENFFAPVGKIVAHWGRFEEIFNSCLLGLIEGEAESGIIRNTEGWRHSAFKRRRKLLKDICKEWLATWNPDIADKLATLANTAGDLAKKRNLIAHGQYAYTILPQSSEVTNCRAVNDQTGDRFDFDRNTLTKLYHDISHMTCDFYFLFKENFQIDGPFYSFPDTQILHTYHKTNHPWNPNPEKRTPPPESSQK